MIYIQSLVIFALIALGVICERRKVLNAVQIEGLEIFLFKIAMPSYLFISTLHHNLATLINTQYIYSYLLSFSVIAIIVAVYFYKHDRKSVLCLKMLASGYVNSAIYVLPVITFLLMDPIAGVIGNLLQVIFIQTIFVTILSIINHKEKSMPGRLMTAFTMPLVAMPIIGLWCNHMQINLHPVIIEVIQSLGNGAVGIALFTFGLTLGAIKLNKTLIDQNVVVIVGIKNIGHPIIAFCIGKYIFHLETYWLHSLLIASSAPTAFMVYLIAKQFSLEPDLAKRTIAVSSLLSLVTLATTILVLG